MCHSAKSSMLFALLLIVALTACSPAATPVPPTATNPPPTMSPTVTPLPTPTPRPAYTSMPMPTPSVAGMLDVGGHKMNLECYGEGSPTIVLDQAWGIGLSDRTWDNVIPNLAAETRICVYDRLNAGASDSIGTHTFVQAAEEWHALMQTAKLEPPYIVVGNSFGGFFALTHASRYPAEVAGVALVDSMHFDFCAKVLAILPAPTSDDVQALTDLRDGCSRRQLLLRGGVGGVDLVEGIDLATEGQQQIRAIKSLGDVPLAVLVEAPSSKNFGKEWPGMPPDLTAKLDQIWQAVQKDYAALPSDSQLIIADHAGRYIQNDEPELVVKAIFSLLDKARQK